LICPSTWTAIGRASVENQRLLRFRQASSQGVPACLIDDQGDAPVPPSCPEMVTWSDLALDTPAATVPTPVSETSLTEIEAEDSRSSGRGSAAPGPRSSRCRGVGRRDQLHAIPLYPVTGVEQPVAGGLYNPAVVITASA